MTTLNDALKAVAAEMRDNSPRYPAGVRNDLAIWANRIEALALVIDEGKQQWDEVARIIGSDGDNVDDVFAKAKALAQPPHGGVVAWLHFVADGDGEPDQALSFKKDSFPFDTVAGYRDVAPPRPLIYGDAHPPQPLSAAEREALEALISHDANPRIETRDAAISAAFVLARKLARAIGCPKCGDPKYHPWCSRLAASPVVPPAPVGAGDGEDLAVVGLYQRAFGELLATVRGECPSLLSEDSGGGAVLIDLVARVEAMERTATAPAHKAGGE